MGDRFYKAQKKAPKRRVLKKDVIADFERLIGSETIPGLDRMTITAIENLHDRVRTKLIMVRTLEKFKKSFERLAKM